jgi:hypothetical protein
MDTIEKRVIEQIEIWSDCNVIHLNDDLVSVLGEGCDLDIIAVMMEVEFDIEILSLDKEIEKVKTVSDLVCLVKSKLISTSYDEPVPQKKDTTESHPTTKDENKNSIVGKSEILLPQKKDTTESHATTKDESKNSIVGESEILLEYSRPDIYRKNAFRISALSVTSTTAEITRQTKLNEMKARFGGKEDQKLSPFPLNPPPTSEEINNALQKLKDPEKRLVDEFFWFWPHELEEGNSDEALTSLSRNDVNTAQKIWISYENQMSMSNVSMHNLAVLSHLLALDSENENGKELSQKEKMRRDMNWKDAFKRWKVLLTYEGFWSRLTERVKQMNDARLKTGTVRRMKESFPVALLQINGMMAVEFAEKGKEEEAKRHLDLIRTSGFDSTAIDKALRRAVDPVRKRIKVICLSACDESEKNNIRGIEFGRQILTQTQNPLKILKILLPEKNIIVEGAEDEIIDNVFNCYIKYVNKTEDYISALELINSIKNFIKSDALKAKVDEKIKTIEGILEFSNFWRLDGYFNYPSKCVEMMEKAYNMEEALNYDEAIDLLRKGLYSLSEIQESNSLRKQFLHCIAYCLRRKSVKIYNEAFSENKLKFNEIFNDLVKYRTFVSEYSSITFCAHCYGSIYSTYYTRTINGVKQPFCNSCNDKIDRQLKDLEEELKKEINKAFDLIVLSKFLSPNHNPTKLDYKVIKESANEYSLRSAEISDLLLKFNLLDLSETIKLLASRGGNNDSKLCSHLISILESQDTNGRIKTFDTLFNNHSALIKDLYPYFFKNETLFSDFVKFVFDARYNLSADRQLDVLNYLLREDNYHIWFRLLSILSISNFQQNIIDSIVKRLIEFIQRIITNIAFDEISFKYGELGEIIQTSAQISEDLKNKCVHAIISAASKDKNKTLKIISAINEDKQAEEVFFQILNSDDPLFDKQMRIQYYEQLLVHWDVTLRRKSIEWLNANIADNQTKIKYFIKSLADPDNSIQSFANELIKIYSEEAAELLLEASYTNNSTQLVNVSVLLKTILFNLNWNSTKTISLSSLFQFCLTHKDKEISQLIFNIIERAYPNWASSQDVNLNKLLREGNYHIWFRLLGILGTSNEQQNTIDSIVKRLIEFIHEIITNISFDKITFKYGGLGEIIHSASQISEDLKSKCIHAIISAASKDKNKALRIISAIYEDNQAEELFFQILYSNDPLFNKQMRIQYFEYLLVHWNSTLRKKSIEWLNANIADNQTKIKYFIKSLADPDNSIQAFANELIKIYSEEAAELLLEASYTNNSTQLVNVSVLLKTILLNLDWNSPKAISLSSLIKICLTHKEKEISQLIYNNIEKRYPDWTSSQDVKSCLKNIKYTAEIGEGHNSQIATELLTKIKAAAFGNRLLIKFSGSEQFDTQAVQNWYEMVLMKKEEASEISTVISSGNTTDDLFTKLKKSGSEQLNTPTIPDWCEFIIMEKEETSELSSFTSSGNTAVDLFNKLKKYRYKLKPVKISGFSKICYEHHISPDGSVLILTVFKEKGYAYNSDKEKSNFWDLYSLELKSVNLKRLFYIEARAYGDIVMLGNSCYATESSGKIVGWNWSNTTNFNLINVPHGYYSYYSYYSKRLNNDLLIDVYNTETYIHEYFSLNNNFKNIDFVTREGETLQKTHKSKNCILISKKPLKSNGYEDYDSPASYLLVSLNDSLSKSSRKEVLKESFKNEISNIDFYGDNHIIYSKKPSKDSKKSDIYIQDLDNNKKYQKVISNVDSGFIWSKSGYILYINYHESTKCRDLIIHKVSSGESIKLLTLTGEGYRDFNISDDWSTFSYLKQTESGKEDDVPCNIYVVNLDMDKEIKDEISIKTENNSYVKIENS